MFSFSVNGFDQIVLASGFGETLQGGAGADTLIGGMGNDTFSFSKGCGGDCIIGFEVGKDHLSFGLDVAPRTMHITDTAQGTMIYFGTMGADGPDHLLLQDVHNWTAADFDFPTTALGPQNLEHIHFGAPSDYIMPA